LSRGCANAALRKEATKATAQTVITTILLKLTGLNMGTSFLVKQRALGPLKLFTGNALSKSDAAAAILLSDFGENT
jgi:hypothetical protein